MHTYIAIMRSVITSNSIVLHKLLAITLFFFTFPMFSLAATSFSPSDCAALSRNLRVGMSGEDVRVLQMLLNAEERTHLGNFGPGSLGMETTYFGEKTRDAVVRFQNLYKGEVLSPVGLASGSGFVGGYTRAKLSELCVPKKITAGSILRETTDSTPPATTGASSTMEKSDVSVGKGNIEVTAPTLPLPLKSSNITPQVNRPSNYVVSPGDSISVLGYGFASLGNVLHVGALAFPNLAPNTRSSLDVVIPLDAPKGKFDLWVSNANGESNKSFLVVVEKGTLPPTVVSFSPVRGSNGTPVSVVGTGFTKSDNEVYFGYAPTKGIASPDGTTLTFTFSMGIPGMPVGQSGVSTTTFPVWFYVVNANGISNNGIFTLTF